MDDIETLRLFALKSISFIYTNNKVKIPSGISDTMKFLKCEVDESFVASFGSVLEKLTNWQKQPRKYLYNKDLESYYSGQVLKKLNARNFLELLVSNIQSSLLNIEAHSSGVVYRYHKIMDVVQQAITRNPVTQDIVSELNNAVEEIEKESIERLQSMASPPFFGSKRSSNTERRLPSEDNVAIESVAHPDESEIEEFYWDLHKIRSKVSDVKEKIVGIMKKYEQILEKCESLKHYLVVSLDNIEEILNNLKELLKTRRDMVRKNLHNQ